MNKENFYKKINEDFPTLEDIREWEIRKTVNKIYGESLIAEIAMGSYLLLGIASIFVYWRIFHIEILLALLLGVLTFFVVSRVVDRIILSILGIEKSIRSELKRNMEEGEKKLEEMGLFD